MILPGLATGSANFKPASGSARRRRRFLDGLGERLHVAIGAQESAEFARQAGVDRLHVDDGVAIDHAHADAVGRFKIDDFHVFLASPECTSPAEDGAGARKA